MYGRIKRGLRDPAVDRCTGGFDLTPPPPNKLNKFTAKKYGDEAPFEAHISFFGKVEIFASQVNVPSGKDRPTPDPFGHSTRMLQGIKHCRSAERHESR